MHDATLDASPSVQAQRRVHPPAAPRGRAPRLLAAALSCALAGCGASNVPAFLGTWTSAASEVETCPTGQHTTSLAGTLTIVAGAVDPQVQTRPPNGCNLTWTVNGNTATLVTGQSCSVAGSLGGTWTPTFTTGTLTLGGGALTLAAAGSATLDFNGTTSCTFTQSGPLTR